MKLNYLYLYMNCIYYLMGLPKIPKMVVVGVGGPNLT